MTRSASRSLTPSRRQRRNPHRGTNDGSKSRSESPGSLTPRQSRSRRHSVPSSVTPRPLHQRRTSGCPESIRYESRRYTRSRSLSRGRGRARDRDPILRWNSRVPRRIPRWKPTWIPRRFFSSRSVSRDPRRLTPVRSLSRDKNSTNDRHSRSPGGEQLRLNNF